MYFGRFKSLVSFFSSVRPYFIFEFKRIVNYHFIRYLLSHENTKMPAIRRVKINFHYSYIRKKKNIKEHFMMKTLIDFRLFAIFEKKKNLKKMRSSCYGWIPLLFVRAYVYMILFSFQRNNKKIVKRKKWKRGNKGSSNFFFLIYHTKDVLNCFYEGAFDAITN